jgi:hypothetical protein
LLVLRGFLALTLLRAGSRVVDLGRACAVATGQVRKLAATPKNFCRPGALVYPCYQKQSNLMLALSHVASLSVSSFIPRGSRLMDSF